MLLAFKSVISKMKNAIIILLISVLTVQGEQSVSVDTLVDTREQNEDGYHFKYSTSDGQQREESGIYDKMGENLILRIKGFYSYHDVDGKLYKVTYRADDNGYEAVVDYKPTFGGNQMSIERITTQAPPQTSQEGVFEAIPIIATSAIASLAGGGLG